MAAQQLTLEDFEILCREEAQEGKPITATFTFAPDGQVSVQVGPKSIAATGQITQGFLAVLQQFDDDQAKDEAEALAVLTSIQAKRKG